MSRAHIYDSIATPAIKLSAPEFSERLTRGTLDCFNDANICHLKIAEEETRVCPR